MKHKITQKIPKLKASVEEFAAEVMNEDLLEISSNLQETLAKVEKLDTLCATLTQKSKDINEFQKTLDMDVSAFGYVEDTRVAMQYRSKLWRSLHEWGNVLVEKWRTAPFEKVDVSEITQKSEFYTKIALQCERNLPSNSTAV